MTYVGVITVAHTALSLLAFLVDIPAIMGLFERGVPTRAADAFALLAIVASLTGFLFPFKAMTPAIVTGVIALAVLGIVLYARYRPSRLWRRTYAVGPVVSEYLLVFVGAVQAFLKVPELHRLAPTQSEPPFLAAQVLPLVAFAGLAMVSAVRAGRGTLTPA